MTVDLPGPHGYLTCEEAQSANERYRKGLDQIVDRACKHCSAFERAASAIGLTWKPREVTDQLDLVRGINDGLREELGHSRSHAATQWSLLERLARVLNYEAESCLAVKHYDCESCRVLDELSAITGIER